VDVHIEEQPIESLVEHARIPIAFKVERILTVSIPSLVSLGSICRR
jgi:hypothetical protein